MDGVLSNTKSVLSRIPQGSISGPMLFLVFINDMPMYTTTKTTLALFADNSKCYRVISSHTDTISLQNDLTGITEWIEKWMLRFNTHKCESMHIIHKKTPTLSTYIINNTPVRNVYEASDLGVITTENLTRSSRVQKVVSKANRMLGLVKRCSPVRLNIASKWSLYLSLVRPCVGYGSKVWSPISIRT